MKNLNIDNWLEQERKKNPGRVPDGYFEDFQRKMARMAREASAEEGREGGETTKAGEIRLSVWMRMRPYVALAASFILMVTVGGLFLKNVTPAQELDNDELFGYYEEIIPRTDPDIIFYAQAMEGEDTSNDYSY